MAVRSCPLCGRDNRAEANFALCGASLSAAAPGQYVPLSPGYVLQNGDYRIVRQLEQGGIAALYIVEDTGAFGNAKTVCYSGICVGKRVTVVRTGEERLRTRVTPSLSGQVLGKVDDGDVLTVIDGPIETDRYTWWYIQTSGGIRGWVAADWLEPTN